MEALLYFRNKIKRHIEWNGQMFTFTRFKKNEFDEITNEVDKNFHFKGLFHDGGGYGGMLNIELFERDGGRTFTRFKPMILCMFEDGDDIQTDDVVNISEDVFRVVEKSDVKELGVVYEISLEKDNGRL